MQPVSQAVVQETETRRSKDWLKELFHTSLVAAALIVLMIVFSIFSPHFFSTSNFYHILQEVAVVGILTVGQAFVIITAGIDMAQGAVIGLTGVVAALLMSQHVSVWLAVLAGLGIGVLVGLVNGLLITVAGITPFIATLGTMSICTGAALVTTSGQPVFGIPNSVSNFGSNGILGILPFTALVMIVVAIVFHFVLNNTRFGRYTYAIGSNPLSARLSGLRIERHLIWVYIISGVMSAIGGVVMIAWVNSAMPTAGNNYQLNSIASVVIGGGSLFGGEGTIWGSMIGALLMSVLSDGSQLLGVSSYWQSILLGLVVVIAVFIDRFRRRSAV